MGLRIVCLGWGSLIWDPGCLALKATHQPWHRDGPQLPIEFARESLGGKITLVITDGTPTVPVLWADLSFENISPARANLTDREWKNGKPSAVVGVWSEEGHENALQTQVVAEWARTKGIDGVVWTKLPPRFAGKDGIVAQAGDVVSHLASIHDPAKAEEYVRRAPPQIATPYRKVIEETLGWTYDGSLTDQQICGDISG